MFLSRYSIFLTCQLLFIIIDLFINSFSIYSRTNYFALIILSILQIIFLKLSLIVLILSFFNTFVFHTGHLVLLLDRFRVIIIICVLYFIMTLSLNISTIVFLYYQQSTYILPNGLYYGWAFHKFGAAIYYYVYKRAALKIGDPKFYHCPTIY